MTAHEKHSCVSREKRLHPDDFNFRYANDDSAVSRGMCGLGPPKSPGPPVLMKIPPGYPTKGQAFSICLTWALPDNGNGSRIQLYQVVMRKIVDGVPMGFLQVP
jgi:hypothetical protein